MGSIAIGFFLWSDSTNNTGCDILVSRDHDSLAVCTQCVRQTTATGGVFAQADRNIELQEISASDSIKLSKQEIGLYKKEAKEYFDAAIYYLEHAVELKSDDPDVLNMLAIAYANVGLSDKAEAIFNHEEQLKPN